MFFANFEESHAVQYFYEPFLQAFDPKLRKELGVWFTRTYTRGSVRPSEDLKVTVGWGHAGKGGATMPGKGRIIERAYSPEEREAIARGAERANLSIDEALAHVGERTCDVYLNDVAFWKNIPARVWDYTIGGYPVIKKWLSYREFELLDRPLTPEEAREIMNITRRIAAIVLMEPALDKNYQAVQSATYEWPFGELGES